MCILFWTVDNHPKFKFIFASNRDEFIERSTARANFWESNENILAGVDLEPQQIGSIKDGTWLGITRQGRFAALTNYREPKAPRALSRGLLIKNFLCDTSSATTILENIQKREEDYAGFNLVCFDFGKKETNMAYLTNRENQPIIQLKPKKIYGLSNSVLNNPWEKVDKGKELFKDIIKVNDGEELITLLFDLLKTGDPMVKIDDIPSIYAGLQERIFINTFNNSPNSKNMDLAYGTRTSTIVLIDYDGNVTFVERDWNIKNPVSSNTDKYDDRSFQFQLQRE